MSSTASGMPAVELIDISKSFPGVVANDRIRLTVMRGEVLCLLGENGAGKSTLMSILAGLHQPDSGRIRVAGEEVRIDSPGRGRELGIGMVYQHLSLIPTLTVLENLMLGSNAGFVLDRDSARAHLRELAASLGVAVEPDARVGALALGQQQQIEIIKALWRGSRVLVLDEPTSMLTPQGIAELQNVLLGLKASGLAIIFITHKLHEAIAIGDRVVVLKLGRVVGTLEPAELAAATPHELQQRIVGLMFGEQAEPASEIAELREEGMTARRRRAISNEPVLELIDASAEDLHGQYGMDHVSLRVNAGEIHGVGGVDGNGQRALAEAVAGQRALTGGAILLEGHSLAGLGVADRQRLGLRYVTDDRLGEGVVASYSVGLNIVLKRIGEAPFWRRGAIDRRRINSTARMLIEEFDIRTPHADTRIGALSGGNIQKTLLARELSFDPRAVVFHKPTHGLDVRTMAMVRERIRDLAERGIAIMVISTDLDELIDLCDRVAVLFEGRIAGTVEVGPGAEARIGELILGGRAAA
jgi:simple sugar transport system ATP-binding protein